MTSNPRITIPALAAALAAASLALPGAALARGGGSGGGGGTPAPAPTPTPVPTCDFSLDGLQPDGSNLFTNPVADAGCLTVRASGSQLRVYSVVVWPGWTYVITSNGEGTTSRVAVTFTQTATGVTHEARIEFGKTVIK